MTKRTSPTTGVYALDPVAGVRLAAALKVESPAPADLALKAALVEAADRLGPSR